MCCHGSILVMEGHGRQEDTKMLSTHFASKKSDREFVRALVLAVRSQSTKDNRYGQDAVQVAQKLCSNGICQVIWKPAKLHN